MIKPPADGSKYVSISFLTGQMLKLLRRANANINQIAKHLHETGRVYDTDLEEILGYQKEIYKGQNELLTRLVKLQ